MNLRQAGTAYREALESWQAEMEDKLEDIRSILSAMDNATCIENDEPTNSKAGEFVNVVEIRTNLKPLTAIEKIVAYLKDRADFGATKKQIATALKMNPRTVNSTMAKHKRKFRTVQGRGVGSPIIYFLK